MQFQVPQFIETEDKIVGPFTLKQFFWVAGGVAVLFIVYLGLGIGWFFISAGPVAIASLFMAFYKIDGLSVPLYLFRGLIYMLGGKKYYYQPARSNITENDGEK